MSFSGRLLFVVLVVTLDVFVVFLQSEISTTHALVVTSPRWDGDAAQRTRRNDVINAKATSAQQPKLDLRIRSTIPEDIPEVATILSHALVEVEQQQQDQQQQRQQSQIRIPFDFKRKMEFLKTKSGVVTMLHSRMEAMTIGKKLWTSVSTAPTEGLNDNDKLRYVWSNDAFRAKMEKACKLSDEPHVWKDYNFACAPQKTDVLFHKMLTAENVVTGEIVGFCEVAMLSKPKHWYSFNDESSLGNDDDEECKMNEPFPTIVNLVTAADYRRRGIASSILRSASKFVQHQGCSKELALYVEQKNGRAVLMYKNMGFKAKYDNSNQIYMMAGLSSYPPTERPRVPSLR